MKSIITIKGTDLLDLLCEGKLAFDGCTDGIKDEDRIERVQLRYGDEIDITIGEEDEEETKPLA